MSWDSSDEDGPDKEELRDIFDGLKDKSTGTASRSALVKKLQLETYYNQANHVQMAGGAGDQLTFDDFFQGIKGGGATPAKLKDTESDPAHSSSPLTTTTKLVEPVVEDDIDEIESFGDIEEIDTTIARDDMRTESPEPVTEVTEPSFNSGHTQDIPEISTISDNGAVGQFATPDEPSDQIVENTVSAMGDSGMSENIADISEISQTLPPANTGSAPSDGSNTSENAIGEISDEEVPSNSEEQLQTRLSASEATGPPSQTPDAHLEDANGDAPKKDDSIASGKPPLHKQDKSGGAGPKKTAQQGPSPDIGKEPAKKPPEQSAQQKEGRLGRMESDKTVETNESNGTSATQASNGSLRGFGMKFDEDSDDSDDANNQFFDEVGKSPPLSKMEDEEDGIMDAMLKGGLSSKKGSAKHSEEKKPEPGEESDDESKGDEEKPLDPDGTDEEHPGETAAARAKREAKEKKKKKKEDKAKAKEELKKKKAEEAKKNKEEKEEKKRKKTEAAEQKKKKLQAEKEEKKKKLEVDKQVKQKEKNAEKEAKKQEQEEKKKKKQTDKESKRLEKDPQKKEWKKALFRCCSRKGKSKEKDSSANMEDDCNRSRHDTVGLEDDGVNDSRCSSDDEEIDIAESVPEIPAKDILSPVHNEKDPPHLTEHVQSAPPAPTPQPQKSETQQQENPSDSNSKPIQTEVPPTKTKSRPKRASKQKQQNAFATPITTPEPQHLEQQPVATETSANIGEQHHAEGVVSSEPFDDQNVGDSTPVLSDDDSQGDYVIEPQPQNYNQPQCLDPDLTQIPYQLDKDMMQTYVQLLTKGMKVKVQSNYPANKSKKNKKKKTSVTLSQDLKSLEFKGTKINCLIEDIEDVKISTADVGMEVYLSHVERTQSIRLDLTDDREMTIVCNTILDKTQLETVIRSLMNSQGCPGIDCSGKTVPAAQPNPCRNQQQLKRTQQSSQQQRPPQPVSSHGDSAHSAELAALKAEMELRYSFLMDQQQALLEQQQRFLDQQQKHQADNSQRNASLRYPQQGFHESPAETHLFSSSHQPLRPKLAETPLRRRRPRDTRGEDSHLFAGEQEWARLLKSRSSDSLTDRSQFRPLDPFNNKPTTKSTRKIEYTNFTPLDFNRRLSFGDCEEDIKTKGRQLRELTKHQNTGKSVPNSQTITREKELMPKSKEARSLIDSSLAFSPGAIDQGVLLEGILLKWVSGTVRSSWHERYFMLFGASKELRYYTRFTDAAWGSIPLEERRAIPISLVERIEVPTDRKWDGKRFDLVCNHWGKGRYAVGMQPGKSKPKSSKVFKLLAPDSATRLLWVTVLQKLMLTP